MESVLQRVQKYICEHRLFENDNRPIIVGLSGGADSVALSAILSSLGYNIVCAHCNFHLRGAESNRDATHSQKIAKELGVELVITDFDVETYRSIESLSIEEACRELRYQWFESIREAYGAQKIAVGHNRNDNVETFFFNLQRGTGISGLKGIPPANDRYVVRPLLCLTRSEIEQYLHETGLSFITDSSNLQPIYSRNKIRNIVLPEIRSCFPNIDNGILTTIANMEEISAAYNQFLREKRKQYADSSGRIMLDRLVNNEPMADLMLFEWLKTDGLTRSQARDIVASHKTTGALFPTSSGGYVIDRGVLKKIRSKEEIHPIDHYFSISETTVEEMNGTTSPDVIYLDKTVLIGQPLHVRFWQQGDRIRPFGMNGTKKISDIFSDAKISRANKCHIPLLCKGDQILWVAGLRRSNLYPVDKSSDRIIKIRYIRRPDND